MLIQHSHSWTKCLHYWWSHSIWQRAAAQWKRDLGKELSMQICCWLLILDLRISQNPSVLGCFRQTVMSVILLSWAGSWNIFRNRYGRVVRAKYADVKLPASVLCSKRLKMVQTLTSCVEYKLWAVPSSNVLLPKEHQGLLHFCAWQMGLPQTLGWTGFIDRIKIN